MNELQSTIDKLLNLSWDNIELDPEKVEHIKELKDNASMQNNSWGDWLKELFFMDLELKNDE